MSRWVSIHLGLLLIASVAWAGEGKDAFCQTSLRASAKGETDPLVGDAVATTATGGPFAGAEISWGDGSVESLPSVAVYGYPLSHRYDKSGVYLVTLTTNQLPIWPAWYIPPCVDRAYLTLAPIPPDSASPCVPTSGRYVSNSVTFHGLVGSDLTIPFQWACEGSVCHPCALERTYVAWDYTAVSLQTADILYNAGYYQRGPLKEVVLRPLRAGSTTLRVTALSSWAEGEELGITIEVTDPNATPTPLPTATKSPTTTPTLTLPPTATATTTPTLTLTPTVTPEPTAVETPTEFQRAVSSLLDEGASGPPLDDQGDGVLDAADVWLLGREAMSGS